MDLSRFPNAPAELAGERKDLQPVIPRAFGALDTLVIPQQKWTIGDLIPDATITLLYSDPGIGKTYLAQYMALCTASGTPFLGRTVTPAPVLWIDGDMGHIGTLRRFKQSLTGFCPSYQNTPPQWLNDLHIMTTEYFGENNLCPPNLADFSTLDQIQTYIMAYGIKFAVWDTVRSFTGGMDENSSTETTEIFTNLKRIRDLTGCGFLLLHHANKGAGGNKSYRGSSSLSGDLDTVLYLDAAGADSAERLLKTAKSRYTGTQKISFYMDFSPAELTGEKENNEAVRFTLSTLRQEAERDARIITLREKALAAIKGNPEISQSELYTELDIKRNSDMEAELKQALEGYVEQTKSGNRNRYKYRIVDNV